MIVAEYMNRRCVCGELRKDHAHHHEWVNADGTLKTNPDMRKVRVLAVTNGECTGFLDEIELELGGYPPTNKHLGPLMRNGD